MARRPTVARRVRDARQLGEALEELRNQQQLTQQEMAGWLGVDRTTVVRLESGKLRALTRLIDALGVLGADLMIVSRGVRVEVTEDQR